MPRCRVNIQRVGNTREIPSVAIDATGVGHTLSSIFEPGGIDIDVSPSPPDLNESRQGWYSTDLHEYMVNHPAIGNGEWKARVLIVPTIYKSSGLKTSKPLGLMFDYRLDDNTAQREGCALSQESIDALLLEDKVSGPEKDRVYLRTLAHELGHVFNLKHTVGVPSAQAGSATLMFQTGKLRGDGFPENVGFGLEATDIVWVKKADEHVRPGSDEEFRGSSIEDTAFDEAERIREFTFTVSTRFSDYIPGEPVFLRFSLEAHENIVLDGELSISGGSVAAQIRSPSGRIVYVAPAIHVCPSLRPVPLHAGQRMRTNEAVHFGAKGFSFDETGTYAIRAVYLWPRNGQIRLVPSEQIEFEVDRNSDPALESLSKFLTTRDHGLFSVLGGGRQFEQAISQFPQIARDYGSLRALNTTQLYMAGQALSNGEATNGQGREALEIIEKISWTELDHEQQIARSLLKCQAHAMSGEMQSLAYLTDALREEFNASAECPSDSDESFQAWLDEADERDFWRQRPRRGATMTISNGQPSLESAVEQGGEESAPGEPPHAEVTPAAAKAGKSDHFEGLGRCFKMVIVTLSLLLGAVSLGFAYYGANKVLSTTALQQADVEVLRSFYESGGGHEAGGPELYSHMFDVSSQLKLITNHQARAILGMASGIALLALGFALFVIGVEGAFQLTAQGKGSNGVSLSGSAPGILCFVLAAWLIHAGITRTHTLKTTHYVRPTAAVSAVEGEGPVTRIDQY